MIKGSRIAVGALLFAALVSFALEGRASEEGTKPLTALRPASWDDLLRASCTVYLTNYPFGSGVLVGFDNPDAPPRTFLLTAAHVAEHVLQHSTNVFRIASVDDGGKNTTVFDVSIVQKRCAFFKYTDLCAIDITPDIVRYVKKGNEFLMKYISVNAGHLGEHSDEWWCGVVRYRDFRKHGIRLGTPCKWLGSNIWMWKRFADANETSLCVFDGSIAALPRTTSRIKTTPPSPNGCPAFVTTIPAIHGMSGGPVFATGKTEDGLEYPYLIGIGVSQLFSDRIPLLQCTVRPSVMTNFVAFTNGVTVFAHTDNDKGSYVCPIDLFLDAIMNNKKGD